MCGTGSRELPLVDVSSSDCACCAPAHTPRTTKSASDAAAETASAHAPIRAEYQVAGMTCGHCSSSVAAALTGLDGVTDVQVALVPGGVSTVTIAAIGPFTDARMRDAIAAAGYEVANS